MRMGVIGHYVLLWPHGCCGRRRPRPLCVPVGGGPPASAVRAARFDRRVGSLSGQAPPPTARRQVPPAPSMPVAVGVLQH